VSLPVRTTPEADVQIDRVRQLAGHCETPYISHQMPPSSAADAFQATLELFETGLGLMRQNLRRRHPDASEAEIDRLLDEWLLDRPGAASGDSPCRPVDPTTRLA